MIKTENFESLEICSIEELRNWLEENHSSSASYWLITYKKSEASKYVSRWEVLDELICFGWIDGIRRKVDEKRTMQLISPRKTEHWARSYKLRAKKLIEEGRMHPSGLLSIEKSKSNGLWNFMDDVDNLIIPDDLKVKLASKGEALQFFESINDSSKRFALRWLKLAKTQKTRTKRIDRLVQLSSEAEKLPGS